jgi:hypothetical protein
MFKLKMNRSLFAVIVSVFLSASIVGQNDTSIILQQVTVIDHEDPARVLVKALKQNWRSLERSAPDNLKYYSRKYTSSTNAVDF